MVTFTSSLVALDTDDDDDDDDDDDVKAADNTDLKGSKLAADVENLDLEPPGGLLTPNYKTKQKSIHITRYIFNPNRITAILE